MNNYKLPEGIAGPERDSVRGSKNKNDGRAMRRERRAKS